LKRGRDHFRHSERKSQFPAAGTFARPSPVARLWASRRPSSGNCVLLWVLPGSAATRPGAPKPVTFSRRSTVVHWGGSILPIWKGAALTVCC